MGFWGLELKPRETYTHDYDEVLGKLRITQATLGHATTITKGRSVVQCKVGGKNPVVLCSLLPDKLETCSLNLEFQEQEKVVFSVIGPTSVHLSGYYSLPTNDSCSDDQTGYHGIYIGESEDEESSFASEDSYDREFIVDDDDDDENDDIDFSPSSSRHSKKGKKSSNIKLRKRQMFDNKYAVPEHNASANQKCIASLDVKDDAFTVSNIFKRKPAASNEIHYEEKISQSDRITGLPESKRGQMPTNNKRRKSKMMDKGNDYVVPESKNRVNKKCTTFSNGEDEDAFIVANFFARKI